MEAILTIPNVAGFIGDARLYRLTVPFRRGHHRAEYLLVHAGTTPMRDPETIVFLANVDGWVLDWSPVVSVPHHDHSKALEQCGYAVAELVGV